MGGFFERAMPEEVGIQSEHIQNFIEKLAAYDLCMHSILLIRHGKLVAETYYAPYTAGTLHRMFSITKSFTSLAIGLLREEGKLFLDHKIIDYFPEKLPDGGVHPYLAEVTIKDMLRMASPHQNTTYKLNPEVDWVKSFFLVEPSHLPGTIFSYDTSSSHILAALAEKLSGRPLLEYLRLRFLDDIGFSRNAYVISDPMGVSMGGSGLMATSMDIAKVAWIVMHEGRHNGRQYLPQDYIRAAVSKQIDSSLRELKMDGRQGYGYQFWRVRNNGFAMLGMGGQYAICLPDHDLLLVTTADIQGYPFGRTAVLDALFFEITAKLADGPLAPHESAWIELQKVMREAAIEPLQGDQNPAFAASMSKREYKVEMNPLGIEEVYLELGPNEGSLNYMDKRGPHQLLFGLGEHVISQFPQLDLTCATSAAWFDNNNLIIRSYIIDEEIGTVTIQFCFKDQRATVLLRRNIELKGTSLWRDYHVLNLVSADANSGISSVFRGAQRRYMNGNNHNSKGYLRTR